MMVWDSARDAGTSFPRRRESKCACAATSAHSIGGFTDLGSRLRGNDGNGSIA